MLKRVSAWVSSLVSGFSKKIPANRIIRYKTVDGKKISIYNFEGVVDHFYEDGEGVIIFEEPVKGIYSIAPYSREYLESITLPEGITEIGRGAFVGCSNLKSFAGKFASEDGKCLIVDGRLMAFAPAELAHYNIPIGVTAIEQSSFCGCKSLTSVVIPRGVTEIGYSAFYGCTNLKSIYIPDSVKNIGPEAFSGCERLESISIPNGVTEIRSYTFSWCRNLKSIYIPNSVEKIGYGAFVYCERLECISGFRGVTEIDVSAFSDCRSLKNITIPSTRLDIYSDAFDGCSSLESITCLATTPPYLRVEALPSNVVVYVPREAVEAYRRHDVWGKYRIGAIINATIVVADEMSQGCYGEGEIEYTTEDVRKVDIAPDAVVSHTYENGKDVIVLKNIGHAFQGCNNLRSITLPRCMKSIENSAFKDCLNLESVTIPESVTAIGDGAFENCYSLARIDIPYGIKYISYAAFRDCLNLESVTIPRSITEIGSRAFDGCSNLKSFTGKFASEDGRCLIVYGRLMAFAPAELAHYNIPIGVTAIEESSFYGCKSLTSVVIPRGVTDIGVMAFGDCSSLTRIDLPDGIMCIRWAAFRDCTNLKSIYIPDSVRWIGKGAFAGCSSLESITSLATTPPDLRVEALPSNVVVYVPREAVEAYGRHDVWGKYRIEAME